MNNYENAEKVLQKFFREKYIGAKGFISKPVAEKNRAIKTILEDPKNEKLLSQLDKIAEKYSYKDLKAHNGELNQKIVNYFNVEDGSLVNEDSLSCLFGALNEKLKKQLNTISQDILIDNMKDNVSLFIKETMPEFKDSDYPIYDLAKKFNYPEPVLLVLENKETEFAEKYPAEYADMMKAVRTDSNRRTFLQYSRQLVYNWTVEDMICDFINKGALQSSNIARDMGWVAKTPAERKFLKNADIDASADICMINKKFPDQKVWFEVKCDYTGFFTQQKGIDHRFSQLDKLKESKASTIAIDFKDKCFIIEDALDPYAKIEQVYNKVWKKDVMRYFFNEEDLTNSFKNALITAVVYKANERVATETGQVAQSTSGLTNDLKILEQDSKLYLTNITDKDHYYTVADLTIKIPANSSVEDNYLKQMLFEQANDKFDLEGLKSWEVDSKECFQDFTNEIRNGNYQLDNKDCIKEYEDKYTNLWFQKVLDDKATPISDTLSYGWRAYDNDITGIIPNYKLGEKQIDSSYHFYKNSTDEPHIYYLDSCGLAFALDAGQEMPREELVNNYEKYLVDKDRLTEAATKALARNGIDISSCSEKELKEWALPYGVASCQIEALLDEYFGDDKAYQVFTDSVVVDPEELRELLPQELGYDLEER